MKLVAARCPSCGHGLAPHDDDVVVLCNACRAGVHLGEDGVAAIPITFAAPRDEPTVPRWLPFWVFDCQVRISSRERQPEGPSVGVEEVRFWDEPRRFYVPAWEMSPKSAQSIGSAFLVQPPPCERVEPPEQPSFSPAVVTVDDARNLVQLIIFAVEARRRDWLKNLKFELDPVEPELWALPSHVASRGAAPAKTDE